MADINKSSSVPAQNPAKGIITPSLPTKPIRGDGNKPIGNKSGGKKDGR